MSLRRRRPVECRRKSKAGNCAGRPINAAPCMTSSEVVPALGHRPRLEHRNARRGRLADDLGDGRGRVELGAAHDQRRQRFVLRRDSQAVDRRHAHLRRRVEEERLDPVRAAGVALEVAAERQGTSSSSMRSGSSCCSQTSEIESRSMTSPTRPAAPARPSRAWRSPSKSASGTARPRSAWRGLR